MLVDADCVEATLGGEFELVHEVVVHVMGTPRVEQRRMNGDPHCGVLVAEIVRQLCIRHQVKPHQLHAGSPISIPILPSSSQTEIRELFMAMSGAMRIATQGR